MWLTHIIMQRSYQELYHDNRYYSAVDLPSKKWIADDSLRSISVPSLSSIEAIFCGKRPYIPPRSNHQWVVPISWGGERWIGRSLTWPCVEIICHHVHPVDGFIIESVIEQYYVEIKDQALGVHIERNILVIEKERIVASTEKTLSTLNVDATSKALGSWVGGYGRIIERHRHGIELGHVTLGCIFVMGLWTIHISD